MLLTALLTFILIILGAGGWYFSRLVSEPRVKAVEAAIADEVERGYIDEAWYRGLVKEPFELPSTFGYRLSADWIPATAPGSDGRRRAIVFAHGYGFNRAGSIKYIRHFLESGFDVLIYDHRHSGESGGRHTTMGFYERHDLGLMVAEARRREGPGALIGTHGESMGGATVLLQAFLPGRPDFVIADCPYSDLTGQLAYRLKVEYRLPAFPLIPIASLATRLRTGYFWGQVSPVTLLKKTGGLPEVPILFMHGEADEYIRHEMSVDMFEVKRGIKDIRLTPGADHAKGVVTDPVAYMAKVDEFLARIDPGLAGTRRNDQPQARPGNPG